MDISTYFEPVSLPDLDLMEERPQDRLADVIAIYREKTIFPETENADIAIIGVKEDRFSFNNKGCADAPDQVRKYLYKLYPGNYNPKILDLGNIYCGHRVEDTYFALSAVISELISKNVFPLVIGGSQDLTYANYRAYETLGQIINIVAIDSVFDLGKSDQEFNSRSYLSKILLHQPNYLFNYANIGYQTYLVDNDAIELMKNLYFDIYRLGLVRQNIEDIEPVIRNADMLSFDISAVRQSDAPGNNNVSPNGFYGEEICQLIRYAGLSEKLTSAGFYEINPFLDRDGQSAHLVAQMIWYLIDGFYNRKNEFPSRNKDHYVKYTVSIKDLNENIVFFKSKKTDRWWMEVPVKTGNKQAYERHQMIPCSYKDYQIACSEDVPDRWWQACQKMM